MLQKFMLPFDTNSMVFSFLLHIDLSQEEKHGNSTYMIGFATSKSKDMMYNGRLGDYSWYGNFQPCCYQKVNFYLLKFVTSFFIARNNIDDIHIFPFAVLDYLKDSTKYK